MKKKLIFEIFLNFFHEILWIFSKGFKGGRISRSLILEKFKIFSPKFMTLPKLMKMIWWSNIYHIKSQDTKELVFNKILWNRPFPAKLLTSTFWPFLTNFFWFFIKNGRFGQFGRPIGRYDYTQINRPLILSTKKFKILHNSQ